MKIIRMFSFHQVDNAYSCLFYLLDALKEKYDVQLWAGTKENVINNENYYGLREGRYTDVRLLGGLIVRYRMIREAIKSDVVIINDLEFFRIAYWFKKIFPKKIIIHYNTEIHGEDVSYSKSLVKFYEKRASFPDMIIDCLKERANYRKKTFNINKEVYYINNTLPKTEVNQILESNTDIDGYLKFPNRLPILIYAGGCNLSRGLGQIIESASKFDGKVNFALFCYGNKEDLNHISSMCKETTNCILTHAVPRNILFKIMNYCDIGIQYYDPSVSINHLYAAPSKFFEYIALGLNVISTNNEGVNRIIVDENIGVCTDNNCDIVTALNMLLEKGLANREDIKQKFNDKYCYEVDSKETLKQLIRLIDKD